MRKSINIASQGLGIGQRWEQWLHELSLSGYEIPSGSPMALELQTVFARPGEVVLLDALLPHLNRIIKRTHDRCPHVHIVVATDSDSNQQEQPAGSSCVHYISRAVPPREFVRRIREFQRGNR